MISRFLILIALACLTLTQGLHAEYELTGKTFHESQVLIDDGIYQENSAGDFSKSISRLELKFQRYDEEGFSLFAKLWATYDHMDSFDENSYAVNDNNNEEDIKRLEYQKLILREAYVTANYGPLELKAGQMILNWGRGEEINPVDVVNPEDLTELYTVEKSDRSIPALLFNALLYIEDFTFQAVWIPFFEPSVLPIKGPWADTSILMLKELLTDEQYSRLDFTGKEYARNNDIAHSEVAARLTGMAGSLDYGLVFFYGYNDQGALQINLSEDIYKVVFNKYHGYGLDFAYAISGYTIQGEILYRDRIYYQKPIMSGSAILGSDIIESPDIQSTAGVDKVFFDNLRVLVQVIYNRILDYDEEMLEEEDTFMGMLVFEDKYLRETLTIGLAGFYGYDDEDWMIFPYIEYNLTDNLIARTSVFIIDGPEDAALGQYKKNDMVAFRLTYSF